MRVRRATAADVPRVVEVLTGAFDADPVWSWVFDDPSTRPHLFREFWTFFVEGGLRFDTVSMLERGAAVAVWLPPGGAEIAPEQEPALDAFIAALPTKCAERAHTLIEAFETNRPMDRPHHYLSLLGTDPDQRGHGYGMALLAADLERIDALGEAAYLESSNPGNNKRYAAKGFAPFGSFTMPNGPTVTTMWRDPQPTTRP